MIVFIMEHNKEYYESIIRVIDYLGDDKWDVFPEKGLELASDYWPEIGRMLKEDLHLGWFDYGQFHINNRPQLASLRKDCQYAIERIDKEEYTRNLANEECFSNIKYGKKGYHLSIVAIIISSIAILLEIAKWIWSK